MSAALSSEAWLASIRRAPCASIACGPAGCGDCLADLRSPVEVAPGDVFELAVYPGTSLCTVERLDADGLARGRQRFSDGHSIRWTTSIDALGFPFYRRVPR